MPYNPNVALSESNAPEKTEIIYTSKDISKYNVGDRYQDTKGESRDILAIDVENSKFAAGPVVLFGGGKRRRRRKSRSKSRKSRRKSRKTKRKRRKSRKTKKRRRRRR